ncbi:slit homolog 2 protein [Anolis carolinensis]|uniref:LRRNT domain-containing protein n=1 Tax=Anolis carolinensis TaxID=28377 RepID=R4GBM5_ANOCA|nr:PREDICTED: slit homolog 2 protein [Anolis carolinensis]XP_008111748.1 PREDICTED: slit homolog 2 protein [Anolis carolinensis]XP_016850118.1 PREDICTED: slit homolog 2 protein [Anolis carolinensis]|eukprot:XP_003222722.1 PREDICTED: slit homolog 2 protein [Anolis carolinensis]
MSSSSMCALVLLFLPVLATHASKACPQGCFCYESSSFVDCHGRHLSHIPHAIPHNTWMLDLRHNNLSGLEGGCFDALWSMKILLLSHNSLTRIWPRAFKSLNFLEKMDFSHNRLARLPHDFSDDLTSLKDLKVAHNYLVALGFESLQFLENLEKLDLSYNRVTSIERGTFRGLSRLRHLYLQSNRLAVVHNGFFFMLQNLEVLLLSNNNISSIEVQAFTSLHNMNLLGLTGNQLIHLKFKTFLNIQTISTHIQLAGNQWACDCDLQRVFGKIMSVRHLHVDDYENITCASPWQLAGSPLISVDSQLCVAETATVLVITVTVLVTVIAAIVMAERNRKKNQEKNWNESEGPFDPQEK